MEAKILDGKAVAKTLRDELAEEVSVFSRLHGHAPALAVVIAGQEPAAQAYVKRIVKSFEDVSAACQVHELPVDMSPPDFQQRISDLSNSKQVSGIIVQMPLPKQLSQEMVTAVLSPDKDVDGIHPANAGRLFLGQPYMVPATPAGGMEILRRYEIPVKGKKAVVVGRSNIVGKPMAMLLLMEHATVTICHSRTPDLGAVIREADILAAAIGKGHMITADMIKPGAVVVDFGVNFLDGKMVGDVEYEGARQVASAITPVPGGTGPVTNMILIKNTLMAARKLAGS